MIEREKDVGKEICKKFFDRMAHTDIEGIKKLLAKDVTVKFPYAMALNSPESLAGRAAYTEYLEGAFKVMSDISFENMQVTEGRDLKTYWVEIDGKSTISNPKGDQIYNQRYVVKMHIENGLIQQYTEYWNPLPMLEIMDEGEIKKYFK